mmetsp:Transcript_12692/g.41543  ORF Transcript_12692/g.41543 Transcript_12692/m.41543 type:complete len:269 (-) Transcript_12692:425-1231(-)
MQQIHTSAACGGQLIGSPPSSRRSPPARHPWVGHELLNSRPEARGRLPGLVEGQVGVTNPHVPRLSACAAGDERHAVSVAQPPHHRNVVACRRGQPSHQVDCTRPALHRPVPEWRERLPHQRLLLSQRRHAGRHPSAPRLDRTQGHALRRHRRADDHSVLDLEELRLERRREGQVSHAPAHHAKGLGEGEEVEDVRALHACVRRGALVLEVLVRVVHQQPRPVHRTQSRHLLERLLRHHHARRVARVDQRHQTERRPAGCGARLHLCR